MIVGDTMKYVNIGGCSVDTLIHIPTLSLIKDDMSLFATNTCTSIGGTGAGKALCLDALGAESTFVTTVGNDDFKPRIISFLDELNQTVYIIPVDFNTAHTNIMHDDGKRISIFTSHLKNIPSVMSNVTDVMSDADVVFLNINEFCRAYIPFIRRTKAKVVVDIHDYDPPNPYHQDFIDAADILIASGVNIPNHREFLEKHMNEGKEVVIITLGSKGLIAMDEQKHVYQLGGYNELTYVDSNGAGDSFCVGFTMKYMESKDIVNSLKYGTICGGIACTSNELFNRNYTKDQIEHIVKEVQL